MELALLLAAALIVLSVFFSLFDTKKYSYRQRGPLFSAAELSFLGVLDRAVHGRYRVFGKVRVADVMTPARGLNRKNWQIAFNKISSKHFDYVLCDKGNLEVIAVIELDDKSHNKKETAARDHFLEQACRSANLKLIRFNVRYGYNTVSVLEKIELSLTAPDVS
jgi:uncharacterized protein DUF2726